MICRLIALDLDGTLLNSKKMISPASVSALQSAQQVGVKIILATGTFAQRSPAVLPAIAVNRADDLL
ncbi:phosphatase [Escherichia coli]|uniref:Phosphatase n=1 Tax=Escherichia coli TaxID=562 RepID=A0A377KEW9_ECOLX|nr:phosphatase [Escherichia coli]